MLNLRYAWKPYLSYGQKKVLDKDMTVYRQGEGGDGFYYLSSGGIKNTILFENGEERNINHISTGMLFGEDGINKNPYLSSATTTAHSVLYYFSHQDLLEICRDHPQSTILFTEFLIYKSRELVQTIRLLDSSVERKIVNYLSQLTYNSSDIIINQTLIAKDLGASRITVNKVIQSWKKQGLVSNSNRIIHISDKDWLQQAAE